MAQDVNFPGYLDLEKISQMNPFVGGLAYDQFQNQNQLANLFSQQGLSKGEQEIKGKSLENLYNEKSMEDRLRQAKVNADYTGNLARETGVRADIGEATKDEAIKSKISEFAKKVSDDDLAQAENQIQTMMFSTDPKVRAQGEQMYKMHRDLVKEREKLTQQSSNAIALAREQGAQARLTQQQAIDAGKYAKTQQAKSFGDSINIALSKAKTASQRQAILTNAAIQAAQMNEPEMAFHFKQQADALDELARRELSSAGTVAPQVGPGGLTYPNRASQVPPSQVQLPTGAPPNQLYNSPTGLPFQGQPQQQQAPAGNKAQNSEEWINRAMQANPGMSREQVIEEGRRRGKL